MALQILIRGKYTLFAAVRGSIIFAYAKSWLHSYRNHETRQQILSIQVKAMNCLWKTGLVILLFSWVAYGRSILEADVGNQGITETPAESQINGLEGKIAPSNSLILNWPAKKPFTIRFAAALYNTSAPDATTAREIETGYKFWEYTLNKRGGIRIGNKDVLVEVKFLYYDKSIDADVNSKQHQACLTAAIEQGEVDFLLGGDTLFAFDDLFVSQQQQRISMLCCHGPPLVYRGAAEAAADGGKENMLFGIHVNSELYTNKLIRSIAVNKKAERIALVVSNRNASIFTSTAANSTMKQLKLLNTSGFYSDFPFFEEMEILQEYTLDSTYHQGIARRIKDEKFDTVVAFMLDSDGKIFLRALQEEKPLLKALFVTVAPTNKNSVANLTASGVRMEHVLSAGQWHILMNFAEDPESYNAPGSSNATKTGRVLWPTSSYFAESFENYTLTYKNSESPSYTHASAAAAAYALQVALTDAFEDCQQGLEPWDGSTSSLLFTNAWNCGSKDTYSLGDAQESGYQRVLRALRSFNRDTFFGKIYFSSDQRNVGRDAVTFQMLNQSETHTDKFLGSIDFGDDAPSSNGGINGSQVNAGDGPRSSSFVRLIQEVVLPSEYETRSLVLPRPPRDDDTDWCAAGYGVDGNGNCNRCQAGTIRASFTGAAKAGDSFTCLKCNLTSYQGSAGAVECNPCPTFSETGFLGATNVDDCVCKPGFYNETFSPGVNCTECPIGATCQGGVLPLILESGFWSTNVTAARAYRAEKGEFDILPCNPQSACANNQGLNQTCAPGWGGNLCSQCGYNNGIDGQEDYFLVFGTCTECTSKAANLLIFLGVMFLWLIINIIMANEIQSFALLIDWFQLLSLVGAINVAWPSSLQKFFSIAQFFAFEVDVVSLRCIDPNWNFLSDMILQFSLPPALISLYIVFCVCVNLYKRQHPKVIEKAANRDKNENEQKQHDLTEAMVENEISIGSKTRSGSILLLPGLSRIPTGLKRVASVTVRTLEKRCILSFDCIVRESLNILEITYLASVQYGFSALRVITVGGETVLAKAPYMAQNTAIVVVGALGLAGYGVFFTVYLVLRLWSLSPDCPFRQLPAGCTTKEKDPGGFIDGKNKTQLGWLYRDFRMEVYYMSAMHLIHRFLFAALVSLVFKYQMQLLMSIPLTIFFAVLFYSKKPYYNNRLNVLQTALYSSLFFQLGFGMCFFPNAPWTPGWSRIFLYANWVMIILVLGILAWVIAMDTFEYWALRKSKAAIKLYLEARVESQRPSDDDVDELVDAFSPTRLWSWIKFQVETEKSIEANADAQEKISLEHFIKVVEDLAKYRYVDPERKILKTDDYSWLSMNDEAELWRSLVNTYPGIVAYIFNGSDQEVIYLYNFYVIFYKNYWNMQESWFEMWYNNLYKFRMKAYWENLIFKLIGKGGGATLQLKEPKVRTAEIKVNEAQLKQQGMIETNSGRPLGLSRRDSSRQGDQRVEHISWLLQSRDRPFIARWLAGIERSQEPRKHFKDIIKAIATTNDKNEICFEEKAMKILSFGMLSLFHKQTIVSREDRSSIQTRSTTAGFDGGDGIKGDSDNS